MTLIKKINSIRAMASVLYDRATGAGHSREEINASLGPMRAALADTINHAAENNIPSCVKAIKSLENQTLGLVDDIKYIQEKIEENRHYENMIKESMRHKIDERLGYFEAEGYIVSLGIDGKINVR